MLPRSFVLAAALCCATPALAQTGARDFRNALGTNFVAIPFGVFTLDYERAIGGMGVSVGTDGLLFVDGEHRLGWAQAKVKYYPAELTLRGFSLGLTAGVITARNRVFFSCAPAQPFPDCSDVTRTESSPTLGVVLDHNWLLGRRERFLVGAGVGARRVLKNVDDGPSPLGQVYPDGRLSVGFVF